MKRGFMRSRRGMSRRADFYVCAICGAVLHGRAGTLHLGILSHRRAHKRRAESELRYESDDPKDRELVYKAGREAINGIEAVKSLEQARLVLEGQICTPSVARLLCKAERERLEKMGQLQ